jgi:hypothetical protein
MLVVIDRVNLVPVQQLGSSRASLRSFLLPTFPRFILARVAYQPSAWHDKPGTKPDFFEQNRNPLLQLSILDSRCLQDGQVGVSAFPHCEEILIRLESSRLVTLQRGRPCQT